FCTKADAELTKTIYKRIPVLRNENTSKQTWDIEFVRLFDMSGDSDIFLAEPTKTSAPLYEAKMIHQFDHRWATFDGSDFRDCTRTEKADVNFRAVPRYYV